MEVCGRNFDYRIEILADARMAITTSKGLILWADSSCSMAAAGSVSEALSILTTTRVLEEPLGEWKGPWRLGQTGPGRRR